MMGTNQQHLSAVIRTARIHDDALPFLLGFLLREIPEDLLCQALAAWTGHLRQLEGLEAPGLALVQAEEQPPQD
jgi:hypothetical protein